MYFMAKTAFRALLFSLLTAFTQVGGLVYLATLGLARVLQIRRPWASIAVFSILYVGTSYAAIWVAPRFGRVPLSCLAGSAETLVVRSPIYCALNRNYVTPDLLRMADALAAHMDARFPGTVTMALDANFPFLDGFPLLPHLSHADGKKLDIAFYYRDGAGRFMNGVTRSPIGYFAFEQPLPTDEQPCAGRNDWLTTRWDLAWLQPVFPSYGIEPERMRVAIVWLSGTGVAEHGVEKVFFEPHLAKALDVEAPAVRFQGCRAARHDDHIHVQIR
jgi:hypothetical protein